MRCALSTRQSISAVMAVGLLVIGTLDARGQQSMTPQVFEHQHDIRPGIETPHTKWAKPYAGGTSRVLFLCSAYQFTPRALIVEQMQRFDIEPTAVYAATRYAAGWFKSEPMILGGRLGRARLMNVLERDFDCYVISEVFFTDVLPEEARYKILARVGAGAGLVVLGTEPFNLLNDELKNKKTPAWLAGMDGVETFTLGEGRAIRPGRGPDLLNVLGADLRRDYACERLGRAILWASKKEPAVRMALEAPTVVVRGALGDARVKLSWESHSRPGEVLARLWVRGLDGKRYPIAGEVVLDRAGGSKNFILPQIPAGQHHIEAQATREGLVETWATRRMEVTSGVSLSLTTTSEVGSRGTGSPDRGEPITGEVHVSGVERFRDAVVRLEMIDVFGRILHRQEITAIDGATRFEIPTSSITPSLVRLAAQVHADGAPIQQSELPKSGGRHGVYVMLTTRHYDEFNFIVWGKTYNQWARPFVAQALAELGATTQVEKNPDWESAAGGLSWIGSGVGIKYRLNEKGLLDPVSWNNEQAVSQWAAAQVARAESSRRMGALVYYLGNEIDTFGADKSKEDLSAYRRYLATVYSDIEALNRSWGSDFASIDEVTLSDPDDVTESTALRRKNYPRWWDRRAFMRHNCAMLMRRLQAAFEEADPYARVGFDGAGWEEDNIDLLTRSVKYWIPYSWIASEVILSVTPPQFIGGQYAPSWPSVIRGGRTIGWWRLDNEGAVHGSLLGPDMTVRARHQPKFNSLRIWLQGLGTAMMHWQRQHDGIVMLHSFPSVNATQIESGTAYGAMMPWGGEKQEFNHAAWHRNIRASGLQFRYVTDGMLDRGEWDGSSDKLLILSQAEAVSPRQADVIGRFAAGGGTVIADVRPGIYDGHMKPQAAGVLDDLFGVRHTGNVSAEIRSGSVEGKIAGHALTTVLREVEVNPALELAAGRALGTLGGTPVIIVNKVGRGRAILLNFTMRSFLKRDEQPTPPDTASAFETLLAAAGVERQIEVTDEAGRRRRDIEVARWRDGGREVIALLREKVDGGAGQRQLIECRLARRRVVTNLRTGISTRATERTTTAIGPDDAILLLLTDAPPAAPTIAMAKTVARGNLAKAAVSLQGGGYRCLRLTARGPDGSEVRALRRVVKLQGENVTLDVPVAFNDPVGDWTIVATDVTTGLSGEARFEVQ